jgi:hypothetical protein
MMRAFPDLLKRMGKSALIFAGVSFAPVLALILILALNPGTIPVQMATVGATRVDLAMSNPIFGGLALIGQIAIFYLLVYGIVCSAACFNKYMAAGVTRREFATGMIAAAALLSACFSLLSIPLLLANNELPLLLVLVLALQGTLMFLIGCIATVGFQLTGILSAVLGLIVAFALLFCMSVLSDLQLYAQLPIFAATIAIAVAGLLWATRRIPVKA